MDKKVKIKYSRYPTNGVILDLMLKGLGIKHKDPNFRKLYNRFLKEENISVDEYYDTQNTVISDIESVFKVDATKNHDSLTIEQLIEGFILHFNSIKVESNTQDNSQQQLEFNLIIETFIPYLAILLQSDKKNIIQNIIPTDTQGSVQILLQIVQSDLADNTNIKVLLENILSKQNYKGYDTTNKNINNWLNGKSIPSLEHVKLIGKLSESTKHFTNNELNNFLHIAKIIQFLYDKAIKYFGIELTDLLIKYFVFFIESVKILLNSLDGSQHRNDYKSINMQTFLSIMDSIDKSKTCDYIKVLNDFYNKQKMLFIDAVLLESISNKTKPSTVKSVKLEEELLCDIEKITSLYDIKYDPYFSFFYARYWAQKREYKKSTELYLIALKYGKNCMGNQIKSIIKEGLIVSAQDTRKKQIDLINAKSSFTKFYKEAYFYKLIDDLPKEISQNFLIDITKKFDIYFENLFPDTNKSTKKIISSNLICNDMTNIKIDYKKPNRLITKNMPNPISQLMYCANKLDFNCIKKLIDNGADVNFLKSNDNATALIVALQAIELRTEISNNDIKELLKIANIFIKNMSLDSLNSTLIKRQDSALSLAITLGLVDIVNLLIKRGLDIENQRLTLDRSTPLVLSIMCIKLSKQTSIDIQLPMFKEDRIKLAKAINIFGNAILDKELDDQLERLISKSEKLDKINPYANNQEDRYKIFDLILSYTKDIDFKDKYNKTALIYAKEIDDEYLVRNILKRKAMV